ncbi:MAG: Glu-tRNA(Gln) amidotransferase subunit GatE [Candidatus Aegiribacteria sp.]|nr:Glu-tRNA(Gln) amidotransferase subunit GatE [Candidatus Aegiribacteria sp.]
MTGIRKMEDMTSSDYSSIGLRSGLEIHQQLDTEKKLFCRCPVLPYSQSFNAEILRHMRPTLSELGEYDGTALMEFKTKKEIIYQINKDTVCTYEMDDTPPFELNLQALDIALEITMLLNCKLISELHIQRKQYLDGSIPAGFQRTTILGVDGWIPYGDRRIGIIQLGLEEDACREVSDKGHDRVYLTDRLGIPLIETVTAPEMVTPHEVAEVAVILSNLARASGKVRRGIGAARQDVNVSVKGGQRVEIKGVSRIPTIPLLVHNEAFRQVMLLSIKSELSKRGITDSSFESSSFNITETLADTQYKPVAEAIKSGLELHAVVLRGYRGILSTVTQPGQTFASEISDRVRVIACLDRLPNITHSDSGGENFSDSEWERIMKSTGTFENDSVVVVWGTGQDLSTAVSEITIRAREAIDGVCNETRQSFPDGTNGFERILPGPNRMYPDTDLPPLAITVEHMERISSALPERPWHRAERYIAAGVPEESARQMSISMLRDHFDRAVKETPYASDVLMHFFLSTLSHLSKRGKAPDLSDDVVIFSLAEAGRRSLPIDAVAHILENMRGSEFKDISLVADKIEMPDLNTLGEAVEQILSGIESKDSEHDVLKRFITGRIRHRYDGLINGKEVSELVHSMVL